MVEEELFATRRSVHVPLRRQSVHGSVDEAEDDREDCVVLGPELNVVKASQRKFPWQSLMSIQRVDVDIVVCVV